MVGVFFGAPCNVCPAIGGVEKAVTCQKVSLSPLPTPDLMNKKKKVENHQFLEYEQSCRVRCSSMAEVVRFFFSAPPLLFFCLAFGGKKKGVSEERVETRKKILPGLPGGLNNLAIFWLPFL